MPNSTKILLLLFPVIICHVCVQGNLEQRQDNPDPRSNVFGSLLTTFGSVEVGGRNFFKLMQQGECVLLYPGGVREVPSPLTMCLLLVQSGHAPDCCYLLDEQELCSLRAQGDVCCCSLFVDRSCSSCLALLTSLAAKDVQCNNFACRCWSASAISCIV